MPTLTEGNKLRLARKKWATYTDTALSVILASPLGDTSLLVWSSISVSGRGKKEGVDYVRFEHTVYLPGLRQS